MRRLLAGLTGVCLTVFACSQEDAKSDARKTLGDKPGAAGGSDAPGGGPDGADPASTDTTEGTVSGGGTGTESGTATQTGTGTDTDTETGTSADYPNFDYKAYLDDDGVVLSDKLDQDPANLRIVGVTWTLVGNPTKANAKQIPLGVEGHFYATCVHKDVANDKPFDCSQYVTFSSTNVNVMRAQADMQGRAYPLSQKPDSKDRYYFKGWSVPGTVSVQAALWVKAGNDYGTIAGSEFLVAMEITAAPTQFKADSLHTDNPPKYYPVDISGDFYTASLTSTDGWKIRPGTFQAAFTSSDQNVISNITGAQFSANNAGKTIISSSYSGVSGQDVVEVLSPKGLDVEKGLNPPALLSAVCHGDSKAVQTNQIMSPIALYVTPEGKKFKYMLYSAKLVTVESSDKDVLDWDPFIGSGNVAYYSLATKAKAGKAQVRYKGFGTVSPWVDVEVKADEVKDVRFLTYPMTLVAGGTSQPFTLGFTCTSGAGTGFGAAATVTVTSTDEAILKVDAFDKAKLGGKLVPVAAGIATINVKVTLDGKETTTQRIFQVQ